MMVISANAIGRGEAVLEGLRAEFGAILAERILESEAVDFLWEARVKERYLGLHFDVGFDGDEDETELARIAILSLFGGRWHVASSLVDGDGTPIDMLWRRSFDSRNEAEAAYQRAA